ncbi:hypothetical protein HMPREF1321_0183 [Capnocytophaga sp. oral taxon 412 str. F0487]|uniref:DUF3592 domain-containing protein n=1 Tax=Capnocytophaga ochracea TaxID=1018 RepID=A0A2X2RBN3_CAPOC|nr:MULTISPECIES: hypothetical protein [Capnocytophaga]EIW90646.1 hypothetical protein HMPREF1321_0183 [Capnocytophaga sp. oral taxon 412 str. F0487]SQA78518.1 Uncharacterised protein [Capnocytophaga ochracea]
MWFFKLWLFLLAFLILIMNLFDIKRIYDALSGNYFQKVMVISKIDYHGGSGGKYNGTPSVFVRGYIDSQEVYFIRNLDENVYDIAGKFDIPNVEIGNSIKVLKFKHSDQVMVVYDNEFARWKKMRIIFSSIGIVGMIVFWHLMKTHKFKNNQ